MQKHPLKKKKKKKKILFSFYSKIFSFIFNLFFIYLLCLIGDFYFSISSHIKLKCTLLIQYLYTNEILLSNSSNSSQKCPFDLIRQFVPKIYYSISKKSNRLLDLVFEICHDSKFFSLRGNVEKCLQ